MRSIFSVADEIESEGKVTIKLLSYGLKASRLSIAELLLLNSSNQTCQVWLLYQIFMLVEN